MSRTMQWTMMVVVGMVLHAATSQAKPIPGAICAAAKQKAAAKKAADELKCQSKAVLTNASVDPACLTKAGTKFSDAVGKAEAKGGCVNTGDVGTIESIVDDFVAAVVTATPASTTTTTLPCNGVGMVLGGVCWFKGDNGANCDDTCAAQGLSYSDATRDYAGSNGTDANCTAVSQALTPGALAATPASSDVGIGCVDLSTNRNGATTRITSPVTDSTSSFSAARYCACQ